MPKFVPGVVRFQTDVFPEKRELFEKLSLGQQPEALFIACSDSRIETAMITQTEPGELFQCRNPGNIVPPHTTHTGGVTASIEFAVSILNVPHVVICGHSECAAMQAAMQPENYAEFDHISDWLYYARAAVSVVNEIGQHSSDQEKRDMLVEQNVILQLRHLKTHPSIAANIAKGCLELHGWVYDIKTGSVKAFDKLKNKFVPVSLLYADQVAAAFAQSCADSCGK